MTLNTSTLIISRLEWSDWELSRSQETVRTNIFQKPSIRKITDVKATNRRRCGTYSHTQPNHLHREQYSNA